MPAAGDGQRIAQKLATYFVSDTPPPALVDRMAQTFQKTDGDTSAVLSTMVHAPEFAASLKSGTKSLGEQIKVEQPKLFQNRDYPVLTDYRAPARWFRSSHDELAATMMRTSEPPH